MEGENSILVRRLFEVAGRVFNAYAFFLFLKAIKGASSSWRLSKICSLPIYDQPLNSLRDGEKQEASKFSPSDDELTNPERFLLPTISFARPPTALLPSPLPPYPLSYSPDDATAALPSSSFDRRPQCLHPLPLILPLPSTPPSPLSPFSIAAIATSTATLSSH
ncbi:hypothetical protein TIFTF001_046885 [Ficus carica]|uniref:Uncharacterized protein n=1 Tax=Ficus carica TaxID=3494 RepID=A0AA87YZ51_FICCA|nr:hypothetical protein TIFTF001_046885 [Ficus carica]